LDLQETQPPAAHHHAPACGHDLEGRVITPNDLSPLVRNELLLINELMVKGRTFTVQRKGSPGAAERRYLQALGLADRAGDQWALTPEGAEVILQLLREDA
jgi:hypothetical protein